MALTWEKGGWTCLKAQAIPLAMVSSGDVLALGNFDGVHLGHRAVLRAAAARAHKEKLKVHAVTFEPHPAVLIKKNKPPFLLTAPDIKTALLRSAGANEVTALAFTEDLAARTPESFVNDILVPEFSPAHVVVGHDFTFGARRQGTPEMLSALLAPHGTDVLEVPPWRDEQGEIISSSRVRDALRQGDPLHARQLLGRPFSVQGPVCHGDERGRTIGFPTANFDLGPVIRPLFGVYAGKAHRVGEKESWAAVINIGVRPTVGGEREWLEAHLLDFDRFIYDQLWEIELWAFVRPEKKFASLEDLKAQIAEDVLHAHRFAGN